MNAKALQQQITKRARTLAAVMTNNPRMKVTISGTQAYQSPGRINIPAGDFTDPEWLQMVEGWIDHELGHERHSLDEPYVISSKTPPLNHLLQGIEDIRMEKAVGQQFRGARSNLNRMATLMNKRQLFAAASSMRKPGANELIFVSALSMYRGRWQVLRQDVMEHLSADAYNTAIEVFGQSMTDEICTVIDRYDSMIDTNDSLAAAQEILAILKRKQDELEKDKPEDEGESGNSDDKSGDAGAEGESGDTGDAGAEGESDDTGDAGAEGESGDTGDAGAEGESDDTGDAAAEGESGAAMPTAREIADAIENALNAKQGDLPRDFHEELARLISVDAEEAQEQEHVEMAGECTMNESSAVKASSMVDKTQAKRLSGSVFQCLHKVLFDQVQSLPTLRTKGTRIKASKLSGIPAGNFAVFKQKTDQQDVSAAITILTDSSGSMYEHTMKDANTSALAFAMGAEKSGIATEVVYFGLDTGGIYTAKRFAENRCQSENFTVVGTGGTPTGEAMQKAMYSLLARPEQNKLMFVLTDGDPNSVERVRQAKQNLNLMGVKVIPIGIGCKQVKGFEDGEFVSVTDASELPQAMKQAIRLGLFK